MSENQISLKKVFIITIPLSGHVNPIIQIANVLINERKGIQVVIYSTENYKNRIEKIGAEFRSYNGVSWHDMNFKLPFNRRVLITSQLIEKQLIIIDANLKRLTSDIKNEKPNLIFYEYQSIFAKYVLRFLNDYHGDAFVKSPSLLLFSTSFINDKNFYPNDRSNHYSGGISTNSTRLVRQDTVKDTKIRFKSYQLSKKFNISYKDPFKEIFEIDCNFENIVLTFPELQPRSHLFQKNNQFVGSCIRTLDEDNQMNSLIEKLIEPCLNTFPVQNPLKSKDDLNNLNKNKLVYVSLGEMFTDNMELYLTIINAFKSSVEEDSTDGNLFVIVSVGEKCFEIFNEMLTNNELRLANNMTIVPFVSQIEILKRASLFITNSDLCSVSESIAYAVPMVCIPITNEQLQVAYRVTTDLGLGVALDFLNLKSNEILYEVMNVLDDTSYNERCIRYSKILAEYDGPKNAADIIEKYMNS